MDADAAHATRPGRRRWWAPEVVQTSSMDCGPAALKCLLDGHGIAASYGRLREACQTSVDGTSIDALEGVAQQLGLHAEQVLVPIEQVMLDGVDDGPALAVVCPDGRATHFIVLWRRVGRWVQVMDPSSGRRWIPLARLRAMLYRHEAEVDAADWLDWARSDEALAALRRRLQRLGVADEVLLDALRRSTDWREAAALDTALRLVQSLVDAGALARGAAAQGLVRTLAERERQAAAGGGGDARGGDLAEAYRCVVPAPGEAARLRVRGAVLLRIGRPAAPPRRESGLADDAPPPSPELQAVLRERPVPVLSLVWRQLRRAGSASPGAWCAALWVVALASAGQMLLLRAMLDLGDHLQGLAQRPLAVAALLVLLIVVAALEWPMARESLRLGRQLELRLRLALSRRLPHLHDRYFQSRPIADMADRAHALHALRALPASALAVLQVLADLVITLAGIAWLAPAAVGWALALALTAVAVPLVAVPWLSERDLRLRTHAAALSGFFLDALQGVVPVRAHRAQRAVMRAHEALAVEWAEALGRAQVASRTLQAVQGVLAVALASGLVFDHWRDGHLAGGSDLLLMFWVLKLPALGQRLSASAQALPSQRNALLRWLEPLTAPGAAREPDDGAAVPAVALRRAPLGLELRGAAVLAGGHRLLEDIDLRVEPGEHVAIVGRSGAGKSTLLGVLLGWHHLAEGELRLDGQPAGADEVRSLRRRMAWVDPAVQLWNRSLLDNLRYASASEHPASLEAALQTADLQPLAGRLPQGLQTPLGESGARLSGGEGQRVRLARALAQGRVRLVLLDEPFRGLDRAQRHERLREARRWWHDRTLLCVTHDVGETLAFPRVLVVEDGRLVEDGVPQDLMARDSRYRALVEAERELDERRWHTGRWRHLQMHDGRLSEREASPP